MKHMKHPSFAVATAAILGLVFGLPVLGIAALLAVVPAGLPSWVVGALLVPLLYPTLFVIVAAALSLPHQAAIVPGKFPRDVMYRPVYRSRRLYDLCWTCVYDNKPVYFIVLAIPWLRRLTSDLMRTWRIARRWAPT